MKQFFLAIICIAFQHSSAQVLKGKVIDNDGIPIEDVSVFNKSKGGHTHTDNQGLFILEQTKITDTIYFSRLGHATQSRVVLDRDLKNPIDITLKEASLSLDQIVLISEKDVLSQVVAVDLNINPIKSAQEILRKVPGLIIGQHAGGGKAEQIFLRGFDIDHGTDVAISVDGMPVNMVSHAHGQGYADLHFVIPETLDNINFGKGPYYADQGDFNTAGYIDLNLKKRLDKSSVTVEGGQFGSRRLVGMFNLIDNQASSALLASEIYLTDGPFDSPQNLNRLNLMGRYVVRDLGKGELILTASHFQSKWDASGQIPQRAVDQGLINRFGAIDDTEGGQTSRSNIYLNHKTELSPKRFLKTDAFLSRYNFELFSNFTFFLEDPENGDQIRQYEDRVLMGIESVFSDHRASLGDLDLDFTAGLGFRFDNIDENQLSRTLNRQTILERLAFGNVDQTNLYGFTGAEVEFGDFKLNPILRIDYFKFDYTNKLSEEYDNRSEEKVAFSPKLNLLYKPSPKTHLFLKTGIGFHSNDTRVVVANEGNEILPAAYGIDLGTILKPWDKFVFNFTLWTLFLEQEFVYVGDAGIVEPSGRTRRLGIEAGARYQAAEWLYIYGDANYTYARSTDAQMGQDFIPLAPDFTAVGGFTMDYGKGLSGGINWRFVDDRPANEDNSIIADGYFVTDANLNYNLGNWTFGLIVENLFDTEWKETQFATESRLFNEPEAVEEIHFTPGTPFYLRGRISVSF